MSRRRYIHGQKNEAEPRLSEELLLAYLEHRLGPDDRRRVEEAMSLEGMESDAIEGLQALGDPNVRELHSDLNASLRVLLKKRRKRRRILPGQRWIWLAIVLILLLAIMSYWLIMMMQQPQN